MRQLAPGKEARVLLFVPILPFRYLMRDTFSVTSVLKFHESQERVRHTSSRSARPPRVDNPGDPESQDRAASRRGTKHDPLSSCTSARFRRAYRRRDASRRRVADPRRRRRYRDDIRCRDQRLIRLGAQLAPTVRRGRPASDQLPPAGHTGQIGKKE